jgi:GAF domain-containing protein
MDDGSVERVAVEHEDPEKVTLALKLQESYPPDPEASSGVPNVLRTGRPEFYPEVTDEMLGAVARDEDHLGLLREIGFTSVIIVPMVARGRTLGAVTLVSAESGRRYGEVDLELAEELARRAALAVDNARLYEEARREIAEREWAQAELRSSRDELGVILGGLPTE